MIGKGKNILNKIIFVSNIIYILNIYNLIVFQNKNEHFSSK